MQDNQKYINKINIVGDNITVSNVNQVIKVYPPPEPPPQIITKSSAWKLNKKDFLLRNDEINEVMEIIRDDMPITLQIRGMGGLGKTSLSCQLFWKYYKSKADGIEHLGWINYNGSLKSSIFQKIESKTVTAEKPDEYLQQARSFFNAIGTKLLLFVDNADDITNDDIDFLTTCACRVVLTARYKIEGVDEYSLPPFSPDVCVELYRKISNDRSPDDEAAIREIVERAGHHTQTIHLLAKTQKVCGYTAQKLLDELKERGFTLAGISADIFSGRLDKRLEADFFEHMKLLFDIAKITDENQLRALKLFSLLAPNVPLDRLTANEWFGINNITKLIQRGWLNEDENNGVYIHPVIAQVVQNSAPTDFKTAEELIDHLGDALEKSKGKGYNIQNKLIPHAVSVAEYFSNKENLTLSALHNKIGIIYLTLADYNNALKYFKKEVIIEQKLIGTTHPATAITYNNIGTVYRATGDYNKALTYYEKALAIKEKVFGTENVSTSTIYNNIAGLYQITGNYESAIVYYEKALDIREKELGTEHPDTAITYNNIALMYNYTADYDKALEYYEKALAIIKNNPGMEHSYTAKTYSNIGLLYENNGDYDNALKCFEKALAINEKVLGKKHPDTASIYNNMAAVYNDIGYYNKALEYYEKALAIKEKVLGTENPSTASTYNNIAVVYNDIGNYESAMVYYKKALDIQEKVLGTENPDTALTYNNIALVYNYIGDHDKALEYYEKALAIFERVHGTEHPLTATTYNNMAVAYKNMGNYDKALEYFEKALAIREKVLGTEHPSTATTYNNMALVYKATGDYDKALEYYEKALAICEKVLGTEHPYTAKTYKNMANLYDEMGDHEKAAEYRAKAGK